MAISRMNMERQLRNMGGLMTLEEPRQGYFLGKIVRKAKKAIKKVVKSPLGKAAILVAGIYGLGGGFGPARFSKALASYQLRKFDQAENELRSIIRKHPFFVDSRAALTALLWRQGLIGEAESNWIAVVGLNNRYLEKNWLLESLRWPQEPMKDLLAFIDLGK